jgi:hypothetical protein
MQSAANSSKHRTAVLLVVEEAVDASDCYEGEGYNLCSAAIGFLGATFMAGRYLCPASKRSAALLLRHGPDVDLPNAFIVVLL